MVVEVLAVVLLLGAQARCNPHPCPESSTPHWSPSTEHGLGNGIYLGDAPLPPSTEALFMLPQKNPGCFPMASFTPELWPSTWTPWQENPDFSLPQFNPGLSLSPWTKGFSLLPIAHGFPSFTSTPNIYDPFAQKPQTCSCGAEINPFARTCSCGADINSFAQKPRTCSCGADINPFARTCSCGAVINPFKPTSRTCSCGADINPFARTCSCGAAIDSFEPTPQTCSCGAEINPFARTCSCGADINPFARTCSCGAEIDPLAAPQKESSSGAAYRPDYRPDYNSYSPHPKPLPPPQQKNFEHIFKPTVKTATPNKHEKKCNS